MIHWLGPHALLRNRAGHFRQGAHSVHLVDVQYPDGVYPSFLKLFPPGTGGLVNEVIGWLLARHNNIPVGARAAIVDVEIRRLGSHAPQWALNCSPPQVAGFAVQQIQANPVALLQSAKDDKDLFDDVCNTRTGQRISALDEWTSNNDRHSGNLIRDCKGNWHAIDFSEMLGSHIWPAMCSMGLVDHTPTLLLSHAVRNMKAAQLKRFASAMVSAADNHAQALATVHHFLGPLITHMHGQKAAEVVLSFLEQRAVPSWMADRLNLI